MAGILFLFVLLIFVGLIFMDGPGGLPPYQEDQDILFCQENKALLEQTYPGKSLIVRNKEIIEIFENPQIAVELATKAFKNGGCHIHHCGGG